MIWLYATRFRLCIEMYVRRVNEDRRRRESSPFLLLPKRRRVGRGRRWGSEKEREKEANSVIAIGSRKLRKMTRILSYLITALDMFSLIFSSFLYRFASTGLRSLVSVMAMSKTTKKKIKTRNIFKWAIKDIDFWASLPDNFSPPSLIWVVEIKKRYSYLL